jgi:hypothetical protein
MKTEIGAIAFSVLFIAWTWNQPIKPKRFMKSKSKVQSSKQLLLCILEEPIECFDSS